MLKKVYIGEALARCGDELYLNTIGDEPIKLTVKNQELIEDMYCKGFKITVEEISEEEVKEYVKEYNNKL